MVFDKYCQLIFSPRERFVTAVASCLWQNCLFLVVILAPKPYLKVHQFVESRQRVRWDVLISL